MFFPKKTTYRKDSDETKYKYVSFYIKDEQLIEKYNEVWEKVKNSLKKEFDIEPVYNEKYLKSKIKSYNKKTNTYSFSIYLFISKNYCRQVCLQECKYVVKERKIYNYIVDDIEVSSDSDGKIPMKKILMKKII